MTSSIHPVCTLDVLLPVTLQAFFGCEFGFVDYLAWVKLLDTVCKHDLISNRCYLNLL